MPVESTLVPNDVVLTGTTSQFGAGAGVTATLVPNNVVLTGTTSQFGGPAAADTVAPVIDGFSPSAGATILSSASVAFDVTDNLDELGRVVVIAEHGGQPFDVVHDGTAFMGPYAAGSTRTPITGGYGYLVTRDGGWPAAAMTLRIFAPDLDGNEATPTSYAYTVSNPAAPDTTAPVVENVVPTAGTPIGRLAAVTFDVVDAGGIRRTFVTARFEDGSYDVVHDGDAFGPMYSGISSRTVVGERTTYVIRRRRGWSSAPTIGVFPIDTAGNEG